MSAHKSLSLMQHLQAGQLPMFMTGPEIKEHYGPSERDTGETNESFWNRKLEESKQVVKGEYNENGKDTSLYESIKKHGVKEPVEMLGDRVWDGHHRVAAAAHGNPTALIPLEHE